MFYRYKLIYAYYEKLKNFLCRYLEYGLDRGFIFLSQSDYCIWQIR